MIPDFIEVFDGALDDDACASIVARMRDSDALQPGRVGGGVFPELKDSRDLSLAGRAGWEEVDARLHSVVFAGVLKYLRKYPQAIVAPLMMQVADADGSARRVTAEEIAAMDDATLGPLAAVSLRPGVTNLQWYRADSGGYPYWHCELYPRDPQCETLHRHLLWTLYLNDAFEEGETEFLFQERSIKPRTGDLLIAPTAFTHTQRGNTPRGGDKFIATGWILFQRAETLLRR